MKRAIRWLGLIAAGLIACPLLGFDRPVSAAGSSDTPAATESPATPIVLVIGAGGTAEYAEQFRRWADRWRQAAEKSDATVIEIGREPTEIADRERLQQAIASLSGDESTPAWIVLIGHGTYAREVAKFNLVGRDVSAAEFATWLEPVRRPVVIVDCTSASGPWVNRLSSPTRVVVTATKSGIEQNFARFGQFFAEAVASQASDLDHDDEVSVHEAFLYAGAAVEQFYESESRISTEHALIDDNGDGKGTPAKMFRGTRPIAQAKDGAPLDGRAASRITLALSDKRLKLTADEVQQRDRIEAEIDQIRQRKSDLAAEEYQDRLLPLLIRQAKIYQSAELRSPEISE